MTELIDSATMALAAGGATWLIKNIWTKILHPLWINITSGDFRIDSHSWVGDLDVDGHREKIELKQRGYRVSCRAVTTDGLWKGRTYLLDGEFRNSVLIMKWRSADKEHNDSGTASLKLLPSHEKLIGYSLHIDQKSGAIKSARYEWKKPA